MGFTLVVNLECQGLDLLSYLKLHEKQTKYKKSDFKDIGQHVTKILWCTHTQSQRKSPCSNDNTGKGAA